MSQPSPIRLLPAHIAERIAAGEVVERPASLVKELLENSLDAGAGAVSVEIRDGGLSLIRVADDGHGMGREDLPLAVQRFSTSKIQQMSDLDAIRTLGFRGEALASIASVARLEILSRRRDELEGTLLHSLDGSQTVSPAASPDGTSVTVRDLFYNTPARRKFLKSPMREGQLVRQVVVRYALAYPQVAFRLLVNGRESFAAPPAPPLERLAAALGRESAGEMLPVVWAAADLRIEGFISAPTIGGPDRHGQHFFINGRPVRSGLLAVMLERPYAGRLPVSRRPLGVIHIHLDPHLVDVNVHPRKEEVRLSQERSIYGAVSRAVEQALIPYPVTESMASGIAWPFADQPFAPLSLREGSAAYVTGATRPLGQLQNAYIVAQGREGLLVVDQHAAHELVLYERLMAGGESQPLSPPLRIELTQREAELLTPFLPAFVDLGLELESFGGNAFLLRSLPGALAGSHPPGLLDGLLGELPGCRALDPEAVREKLAMKAACVSAIKAGDILSIEQMAELLDGLEAAWSPATCPHGRPAFVLLTVEELERRFMRR
ncbi:MAG: DNA mismatch repair endonuclease MutL [Caldilineaceae bacterium]|nr:DNA mismatch repair endonuclease MutL [Caldilineaceae bacterium]